MTSRPISIPQFDGNRLNFRQWLATIRDTAADFETRAGQVSAHLFTPAEWVRTSLAGYQSPVHNDLGVLITPETLGTAYVPLAEPVAPAANCTNQALSLSIKRNSRVLMRKPAK